MTRVTAHKHWKILKSILQYIHKNPNMFILEKPLTILFVTLQTFHFLGMVNIEWFFKC